MNRLKKIVESMQFIADLRFLPDRVQKCLFSTCTRVIEVTSALIMIGLAIVLLLSSHDFFIVDLYQKFEYAHPLKLAFIMLIVAINQLVVMVFNSARSNVLSGFVLLLSAFIWFLVFSLFLAAYPPISTGMTTYLILSIVCALTGRALVTRNREKIEAEIEAEIEQKRMLNE